MNVDFSIAKSFNTKAERGRSVVKRATEMDAMRQFFRPCVLAFFSLAVVYAGFSYGYKLSQYFQHSEVTRASLTRAWVDHRNDSIAIVPHGQEQVGPAKLLGLVLLSVAVVALRVSRRTPDLVLDQPAPAREAFLFSSLIPFRAPPITTPSLA